MLPPPPGSDDKFSLAMMLVTGAVFTIAVAIGAIFISYQIAGIKGPLFLVVFIGAFTLAVIEVEKRL